MTTASRLMHLGAFLMETGHHAAAWRQPDVQADAGTDFRAYVTVVGSATTVADVMQTWFESEAADGFNVMPAELPGDLDAFCSLVVPELQRRGLFRTTYTGRTLREHFGLRRPVRA